MSINSLKQVDFSKSEIAFVMKPSNNDSNSISVYVPTIMSEIEMGDTVWKRNELISSSMIKNSNFKINFDSNIKIKNYLDIGSKNMSNIAPPKVNIGEKVSIKFLDGDLKKGVYTHEDVSEELRTSDYYHISIKDKEKVTDPDSTYDFIMDSNTQLIQLKMGQGRGEKKELKIELSGNGYINLIGDTNITGDLYINDINILEYIDELKTEHEQEIIKLKEEYDQKIMNLKNELVNMINSISK